MPTIASTAENFRRNFRQILRSPASWSLIGLLFLVQATFAAWDFATAQQLSDSGKIGQAQAILGLTKATFLSGEFWQLGSYVLVHGNWSHLFLNTAALLLLGSKLEHIVHKRSYWLLCIYSSIAGGLVFLVASDATQTLVGCSAICFGLLLLLTTLSPDSRFLPVFLSGRSLGAIIILANLFLTLINPALPTGALAKFGASLSESFESLFAVSHACHLGGALTGWLYGKYLLRPRVTLERLRKAREKSERKSR